MTKPSTLSEILHVKVPVKPFSRSIVYDTKALKDEHHEIWDMWWSKQREDMTEKIEGTKYDTGKDRWDLLPWDALEQVVKVYTMGSLKYKSRNWELGIAYSRIVRALLGHIVHRLLGSKSDLESGLNPMAHAAWGCLAIVAYDLRGMDSKFDDVSPGVREHETNPERAKA